MAKTTQSPKTQAHRPDMQSTQGYMVAVADYDTDSFRVIGVYTFQATAEQIFADIVLEDHQGKFIIPIITAN